MTQPNVISPLDRDALQQQFRSASPFPFVRIDGFLSDAFAAEVEKSYPPFDEALRMGRSFDAVNEKRKVQVTDYGRFPDPVKRLSDALSSPAFLEDVAYITGIPKLLWDGELAGGGMHQTADAGRLDVHIDFNYIRERQLHRRLNILVYLNPVWEDHWGGRIELWDRDVKKCHQSFAPVHNRCVIFETSAISYHGVTPLKLPPGIVRKSFAAYYYTREAPASWTGKEHSTVFRARPDEVVKGLLLMPAERARYAVQDLVRSAKRRLRDVLVPR
jgi:hypothetical protein